MSQLLRKAYAAFNARNIDMALSVMQPDVIWPNGMEGGTVHGHEGIRAYWTRQWGLVDPYVEPVGFQTEPDGTVVVEVRQLVKDLAGNVLVDQTVWHAYTIEGGLIRSMDIRKA